MRTDELNESLETLFRELVEGAPHGGAYILNAGDPGLLAVLDDLDAAAASVAREGGATIAAHAAHLAYGISLLNRWAGGENPYPDADWSRAWRIAAVTPDEWASVRRDLRQQTSRWSEGLGSPREVAPVELNGMIASIAHLAYHLGAIRQIHPSTRGPRDPGTPGPAP